jgi:hypothetical protein
MFRQIGVEIATERDIDPLIAGAGIKITWPASYPFLVHRVN